MSLEVTGQQLRQIDVPGEYTPKSLALTLNFFPTWLWSERKDTHLSVYFSQGFAQENRIESQNHRII